MPPLVPPGWRSHEADAIPAPAPGAFPTVEGAHGSVGGGVKPIHCLCWGATGAVRWPHQSDGPPPATTTGSLGNAPDIHGTVVTVFACIRSIDANL